MKYIFLAFGIIIGAILIVLFPNIINLFPDFQFVQVSKDYTYDALAVILSALTATLTALAIAIALLAFFGYNKIKEGAEEKAKEIASEEIKKYEQQIQKLNTQKEKVKNELGKEEKINIQE